MKINHTMYIKYFNRFMFNKTKHETKKHFCRHCLQCFSSERGLMEHRKICLEINGKQSVKLESGTISFENHFKRIAVPFQVYADFESILKGFQINDKDKNTSYTEKYQDHNPFSFADKVVCIDNKFTKPAVPYRVKVPVNIVIKGFLEEYGYCKKVIKKILI